jgi:hypothetical protein
MTKKSDELAVKAVETKRSAALSLLTEDLKTIKEVQAMLLETFGRKFDRATIYRWCYTGCRGNKLEHLKMGKTIYISQEAITRFIEVLTK